MKKRIATVVLSFLMILTLITPVDASTTYLKATVTSKLTGGSEAKTSQGYSTDGVKITVKVTYKKYDISYVKYLAGSKSAKTVKKSGKQLEYNADTKTATLKVKKNQVYTFLICDKKGHTLCKKYSVEKYSNPEYTDQYKAVWFPYYTYQEEYTSKHKKNNTAANFRKYFRGVLSTVQKNNFNCIIVHVRAFGDAWYDSDYFPTSTYIAGSQGKKLSYDPLKIMVQEAHKKGIRIEAWINPYRVACNTSYSKLSKNNQARKWHNSSKASVRRNVLSYGGSLYYNPSSKAARKLIVNGVKEIVSNYDVDAIHMDDYFYPSFKSSNYKKVFDAKEYNASSEKKEGMSIVDYRRKQVNTLVQSIYSAVKAINPDVEFGISPAGNIDNLTSKTSYYVDITKWTQNTGYVDYIEPQIYWGFKHSYAKFDKVLKRWISITDQSKVKLYVGLASYKVGTSEVSCSAEKAEFKSSSVLRHMIQYGRSKNVDGFATFEYADLKRKKAAKAVKQMKLELQ